MKHLWRIRCYGVSDTFTEGNYVFYVLADGVDSAVAIVREHFEADAVFTSIESMDEIRTDLIWRRSGPK